MKNLFFNFNNTSFNCLFKGNWVVLENIHLMPKWCKELEQKLDEYFEEGSHEDFRVFLSAEPSPQIPIGILERSIKLTNEPPQCKLILYICKFLI